MPDSVMRAGRATFAALAIPNYRRYFCGQAVSLIGTWMQMTAQAWLVLTLTHSATMLGLVVALQALPVLLLGPYGGVVADRVDKRRLMVVLQALMGIQALILGVLTVTGEVRFWQVAVLAVALGANNAFESPCRQSFILEMVGPGALRNAVSLNSVLMNAARTIGPAIAGVLIATVGLGVCFLLNSVSFIAVIGSLVTLHRPALRPTAPVARERGQLREGLRYASRTPELTIPLVMMVFIGMLAYEFQVTLPVLAHQVFHQGAAVFGLMTASMGVGAVVGGLYTAARGRTGLRPLLIAASAFGVLILALSAAPTLPVALVLLLFVGAASVSFTAISNTTLQLASAPNMRGRVMSLWLVAFQGSTPLGGPIIGWVCAWAGPRVGLGVGGVTCVLVVLAALLFLRSRPRPARRAGYPWARIGVRVRAAAR